MKLAADQGWVNGYADGTFRPNENIRTEEAAAALLRLLGYGSADLTGAYPGAQLSKYRALGLADGVDAAQGQYLTRGHCMQIFYNLMESKTKEGQYYGATLGYPLGQDGKLDYASLVSGKMQGPYITVSGTLDLPFDGQMTVYRNGASARLEEAQAYDVYYYNENLKTVWLYHNRVTGLYAAAAPGTAAPTAVTVAGNQYAIGSSEAAYQLSDMGQFSIGDTVTLLLGLDGQIAGIQRAETVSGEHYGVVVSTSSQTYQDAAGQSHTRNMAKISCTDGAVMEFDSGSTKFSAGDLVHAVAEDGKTTLKGLAGKSLSGGVSSDGKRIGQLTLAEDDQGDLSLPAGGRFAENHRCALLRHRRLGQGEPPDPKQRHRGSGQLWGDHQRFGGGSDRFGPHYRLPELDPQRHLQNPDPGGGRADFRQQAVQCENRPGPVHL